MIEINVKGDAKKSFDEIANSGKTADNSIESVTSSVKKLSRVKLTSVSKSVEELANEAEKTKGKTKKLSETIKDIGNNSKTTRGRTDKLGDSVQSLGDKASGAKKKTDELGDSTDKLGDKAVKTKSDIKGLIASFVGFEVAKRTVVGVVSAFSDMQQLMFDISKTTGLTGKSLSNLTDDLDELSTTTRGMEVSSLYKISAIAGQLGIKGKSDILSFTNEIKKLAVTSELTAEEAGSSFAQMLNALNLGVGKLGNLSSTFTALASSTTVSEKGLVDFVQRLSGAGTTIGLTAAQIAGLGATLKDVGLSSELSTTAISQLLIKFLTDTEKITETLKLDYRSFAKLVQDQPNKALETFLVTLGKLDKASKVKALKDMKLAGAGLSSTLLKLSSNTDKLTSNILTASNAFVKATATEEEFKIVSQSLKAKQEQLTSKIKLASYALGKELEPSIISVIDGILPLIGYIKENSVQLVQTAKVVGVVTLAWKGLNLAMSLSPFGRIIAGITAIIGLAVSATKAIKNMRDAYATREKQVKAYLKEINSETYKNKQKVKQYTKLIEQRDLYNRGIHKTIELLKNDKLSDKNRATLERNLRLQGNKYNSLVLQTEELRKHIKLKKVPINKTEKVSIKKDIITHEKKVLSVTQHVSTTGDKPMTVLNSPRTSEPNQPNQPNATQSSKTQSRVRESNERELVTAKNQAARRQEIIDNANKKAIQKAERQREKKRRAIAEANQKAKEALRKRLEEQRRINEEFQDDYKQTVLSTYQYELGLLNDQYNEYSKAVKDKVKLDKWYNTQKDKLIKAKDEVTLQKSIEKSREIYKQHLRDIADEVQAKEEAYRLEKKNLEELKALYSTSSKTIVDSILHGKIDFSQMNSQWEKNVNKLSDRLGDILSEGLSKGFENVDLSNLSTTAIEGVSGLLNQSILGSVQGQEFQSSMVAGGQLLGTVAGTAIGGAVGGAIGSVVGGLIGRGVGGSGKKQSVLVTNNGVGVTESDDKGLFGRSVRLLIDETRKLTLAYQKSMKTINDIGKAFKTNFSYESDFFLVEDMKYSAKEYEERSSKALFASLTGYNEALAKVYESHDFKYDWTKQFIADYIEGSAKDNLKPTELKKRGLTDKEIEELTAFRERTDKLRHEWELIAESSNTDVVTLISKSISSLRATRRQIHVLNYDSKQLLAYQIEESQKAIDEVTTELKVDGITVDNYEAYNQEMIKSGNLTPVMTDRLNLLGTQLIANANAIKELAKARATEISTLIKTNRELELSSKVFLVKYKREHQLNQELKDSELERLGAVKSAIQDNIDDINKSLNAFRFDSTTGESRTKEDNALYDYNSVLNEINQSSTLSEERANELTNQLTSSLRELEALAKSGVISNRDVIAYTTQARDKLSSIKITGDDGGETPQNNALILEAINKSLGNDRTVQEVDQDQLGGILSNLDLDYVQTTQLIKAFSDNILSADELLNIKGLSDENREYIEEVTQVDTSKFQEIDKQIDYLDRIREENKKQNEALEGLDYLMAINADEVRQSRSLLEDLVELQEAT